MIPPLAVALLHAMPSPANPVGGDMLKPYVEPKTPTVALFGCNARANGPEEVKWRDILLQDPLIDFTCVLRTVTEDSPAGAELASRLRSHFGLKDAAWCLIGRSGDLLASGHSLPEPSSLASALELAGELNPVRDLQLRLRSHPTHAEMRMALLQRLGLQVSKRLGATQTSSPDPLDDREDQRVWGSFANQLSQLFVEFDWAVLQLDLNALLPKGCPEKRSPTMQALYRKLRPQVQHYLHGLPEAPFEWSTLLRMDEALGENSVLSVLEGTTPLRTPYHRFSVPYLLPRKLLEEARRTGKWGVALDQFRTFWEGFKTLQLYTDKPYADPSVMPSRPRTVPPPERRKQMQINSLNEGWNSFLAPLLEALIQQGAGTEGIRYLAALDERWALIDVSSRAHQLALSLGRPDLALKWRSLLAAAPPAEGPWQPYTRYINLLLYQQEPNRASVLLSDLYSHGFPIFQQQATKPWQRFLGWTDTQPHWALLGPDGSVIFNQSGNFPGAEALLSQFKQTDMPTPLEAVQAFLKENPDHAAGLQALAELERMAAQEGLTQLARETHQNPLEQSESTPETLRLLADYAETLKRFLGTPYGLVPFPMISWNAIWPRFYGPNAELALNSGIFRSVANETLPRIEADLARRPHDRQLWLAWTSLAPYAQRPFKPLLESLEPGPEDPKNPWPPREVQTQYVGMLLEGRQWFALEAFLAPRWRTFREEMTNLVAVNSTQGRVYNPDAWENVLLPLAQANLHQGKPDEVDALLQSWIQLNLRLGPMTTLRDAAKELGYTEQVTAWSKLPAGSTPF